MMHRIRPKRGIVGGSSACPANDGVLNFAAWDERADRHGARIEASRNWCYSRYVIGIPARVCSQVGREGDIGREKAAASTT